MAGINSQSKFARSIEQNSTNDRSLKQSVNLPQSLIQTITGSQQSLVQNVPCKELNRHQLNAEQGFHREFSPLDQANMWINE